MKKQSVKLHKYYKRILAMMKNSQARNDFKNLMLQAINDEKMAKENSRKNKEKNQGD